jgi:hypothetical protein
MKKKLIALFAACSMITTAVAGLVQTAYADGAPISVVVSDGATDTEKVLTIYYNCDGIATFEGYLTFDNPGASVKSTNFTMAYSAGMGDRNSAVFNRAGDPHDGQYQIMICTYGEGEEAEDPMETADKSIATVTVNVPGDVDVVASLALEVVEERGWSPYAKSTVIATIPANKSDTPAAVAENGIEKQDTVNGSYELSDQVADIYAVQYEFNDDAAVKGVTVQFDGYEYQVKQALTFNDGVVVTGGTVYFAVILSNETGKYAELPELSSANIIPLYE